MANIIQWNCRGFRANYDEIQILTANYNPIALCLQETFLNPNDTVTFKGYSMYNFTSPVGDHHATGGATIMIKDGIPHSEVILDSPLQAKAVTLTSNKHYTICSLYLSPSKVFTLAQLQHLINQLPKPFMLMGDFNAHSVTWGCKDNNNRGNLIENFIMQNNLSLLNDGSFTYLHPASGSFSALDLCLCEPCLYMDFSFSVLDDSHGSDHFPVVIHSDIPEADGVSRWNFKRANWSEFSRFCSQELSEDAFIESDDPALDFTNVLFSIAKRTIPYSSSGPRKINRPWFSEECRDALKQRRKALHKFKKYPTTVNLNICKVWRAKARRIIKSCKRRSWHEYVSRLNTRTPTKKVWDMVRRISGKHKAPKVCHLDDNGTKITDTIEIANKLGQTLANNSSSTHYTPKFQKYKKQQEKKKLNFKSNNQENYNRPFSLRELKQALKKAHDTSPGPDKIHYQLIKHLPTNCLIVLLNIFNSIWTTGSFPDCWREAIIVPVPKPGKDHTNPSNYRPIALTSCICKTMERMVNDRLVWYLEKNKLITVFQSGFRRGRSTLDHLIRFESFIRETFIKREHMIAVFFDLEKAYDTTWKYGILKDLHALGIRGHMAFFIQNFLDGRQFKIRVGAALSDGFDQEQGVPQGSILSVTLFSIKINDIVKCIQPGVECSLYVVDFLISHSAKNIRTAERQLQQSLNRLQIWCDENGFKFSSTKTVCLHFTRKRGLHPDPELTLGRTTIPVVKETKFLGLVFDSKLTFLPHIKYLKTKCTKALNLLRVVANTDWGADKKVLLRLYRSLVRSK